MHRKCKEEKIDEGRNFGRVVKGGKQGCFWRVVWEIQESGDWYGEGAYEKSVVKREWGINMKADKKFEQKVKEALQEECVGILALDKLKQRIDEEISLKEKSMRAKIKKKISNYWN